MPATTTEAGDQTRDAIVAFIRDYRVTYDVAPSLAEIAAGVGLASHNSVREHLERLRDAGVVAWQPGRQRTLRVVQ